MEAQMIPSKFPVAIFLILRISTMSAQTDLTFQKFDAPQNNLPSLSTHGYNVMRQSEMIQKLITYTTSLYDTSWALYDSTALDYDVRGNQISSTTLHFDGDQWMPSIRWLYTYDEKNRKTSEGYEYWDDTEYKPGGILELYQYDGNGKLLRIVVQNHNETIGYFDHQYIDYLYDENDLLITTESTIEREGIWEGSWKSSFIYDGHVRPVKEIKEDFIDGSYKVTEYILNTYTDFDSIETETHYSTYEYDTGSTDTVLTGQYKWEYTPDRKFASVAMYSTEEIWCGTGGTLCLIAISELNYQGDSLMTYLFSASDGYGSPVEEKTLSYYYLNHFNNIDSVIYFTKEYSPDWGLFSRYDYRYETFNTNIASSETVAVFPNPFTETITFDIAETIIETAYLNVYDICGRKIYSGSILEQNLSWQPTFLLSKGVYIYHLMLNGKSFTGKVIKE